MKIILDIDNTDFKKIIADGKEWRAKLHDEMAEDIDIRIVEFHLANGFIELLDAIKHIKEG